MSDIHKPKISVTPEEVVQVLAQEYILSEAMNFQPGLVINTTMRPYFDAKSLIYRLAITLMVMINEEKGNPNLLAVRERLEYVFFTSLEDGAVWITEVEQATHKLGELMFSEERREFSWGIAWFKEIGIDETDPINMAMFAKKWMSQYTMVTKTVRDFAVEVPVY